MRAGETWKVAGGSRGKISTKEDERQTVCAQREPGRHSSGRGRPGHRFGRAHRVLHRSDEGRGAGAGVGWKIGLSAGQAGASVVPTARESTASSGLKATFSAAMKSASPNPQLARAYNHVKKAVFPWGLSP